MVPPCGSLVECVLLFFARFINQREVTPFVAFSESCEGLRGFPGHVRSLITLRHALGTSSRVWPGAVPAFESAVRLAPGFWLRWQLSESPSFCLPVTKRVWHVPFSCRMPGLASQEGRVLRLFSLPEGDVEKRFHSSFQELAFNGRVSLIAT